MDIDRNLDLNAPASSSAPTPARRGSASVADATRPITPVPERLQAHPRHGQPGREQVRRRCSSTSTTTFPARPRSCSPTRGRTRRNNFEPDATGGDPNDVNQLDAEWANSLLNQPNRARPERLVHAAVHAHRRRRLHVRLGPPLQHRDGRRQQRRRRRRRPAGHRRRRRRPQHRRGHRTSSTSRSSSPTSSRSAATRVSACAARSST